MGTSDRSGGGHLFGACVFLASLAAPVTPAGAGEGNPRQTIAPGFTVSRAQGHSTIPGSRLSVRLDEANLGFEETARAPDVLLRSPSKGVTLRVALEEGRLRYSVDLGGRPAIVSSPLGIRVDGVDLGEGATLGAVERYTRDEAYPWRGVHATGRDHCSGARIAVTHAGSGTAFSLELRAFDDAAAFRFVVPGSGSRVPDAASAFRLPAGSVVWYHGARDHYEGIHVRKQLADVPAEDWAAPPLTAQLPDGAGYASITEAALFDYAGMMLQADGQGGFRERLGHAVPPSYPYTLRYGEENAKRLAVPAAIVGPITTPWRVVLVGKDLNALVNSDAIPSLNPPPDPKLFPQGLKTAWLRTGRAVWRYLDGPPSEQRENEAPELRAVRDFEVVKDFSRMAGELGFEHQVVEGQWRRFSEEQLRELVAYSKARSVSIWLWIHSRDQRDPGERRKLFARLHVLGIAGIKVDFFDHEAKETIDLYRAILRDAAEQQLLVDFHGTNKPTGEPRTWPNEMTREGIRGLEYRSTPGWATHNTTLPFTRLLAGHADYTPLLFGERRKDTTWAHQIATLVVLTSPVMIYGANPKSVLENPARELIASIPSVWDETRVLAPSAIGELAAFARRSGDRWYVGVLNGPAARSLKLELAFLGKGKYRATLVRDAGDDGATLAIEERDASPGDTIDVPLRSGGGFVARFASR
jgi:alpha-glucosidase